MNPSGTRLSAKEPTASATAPRPILIREGMLFDPVNFHLFEADDGGIYELLNPSNPARGMEVSQWEIFRRVSFIPSP